MLHRLHKQAAATGITDRISTLEADFDEPWAEIGEGGPYDLIWAAAFLHHVADPARLRPGLRAAAAGRAHRRHRDGLLPPVPARGHRYRPARPRCPPARRHEHPAAPRMDRPPPGRRVHSRGAAPLRYSSRQHSGRTVAERLRPGLSGQAALPRHRRPGRGRPVRLGRAAGRDTAARHRAP
ncbi:class I SAM-dependent methyltransferase [Streptomyces sp. NPDC017260]|uniref:class I SAM-dependent methyltransferase n=1 Tax=unclassified Streptomyces TaxID=2593676 RepID=UPI0037BB1AB7